MMRTFKSLLRRATPSSVVSESDVKAAYRLLLGRESDSAGLRAHLHWAQSRGATPDELATRFLSSPEYRRRTGACDDLVRIDFGNYSVFARSEDSLISQNVIRTGSYEPNVMDHFSSALVPGGSVLDIGANIGLFTMKAAAAVGTQGRVIAVEPLAKNHRALYAGIIHNKYSNVQVLPVAASERSGLISIRCAPNSSNGIVGADEDSEDPSDYVPTHRLDHLLSTLSRLDVIKMDIEGHEPSAWRGMTSLIAKHRPAIFSEFSPIAMRNVGHNAQDYLQMLLEYSHDIRVLHRDTNLVQCSDANAIMREWHEANQRAGLDGELHLDLLICPTERRVE